MRFVKMHGAGNDYVYVNCFDEPVPADPAETARQIADRHFGVGGDGLVLICPSERGDARMRMFNADGSEAENCGNAIRCVAKYLYDHGLTQQQQLQIETGAGVLPLELEVRGGLVERVRVDMGRPILEPAKIPTTLSGEPLSADMLRRASGVAAGTTVVVNAELTIAGENLRVTCVSMGNPHCVTFVDKLSDRWVLELGPKIEHDAHFQRRVNAEFIEVVNPRDVRMRVWERGSGETLACGTGAAAVCVAGVLSGRTERRVTVHLLGGDLELEWADDGRVYMTGPAVEVFSGEWSSRETRAVQPR
ncbi:MAG: diaminopimelate epimerase [Pirellulales bacterium]|nr:diaminopimelate epimerase [Pirellulales bacterium]